MSKWVKLLLEFLRRAFAQPQPPPTPPAPVPSPDAIPIQQIVFDLPFNTAAPITATLANVVITLPQTIEWSWAHPEWVRWANGAPSENGVIGTMWVMARINGIWHAAGWEWLLPETSRSTTEAYPGQPPFIQTKVPPLNGWYPKAGEEIGFMVSTISPAWDGPPASMQRAERSPIVVTRWP